MYGLVNKALKDMICKEHGPQQWARILVAAGLDEDNFISNAPYPDELTYKLVGAASAELGLPAEDVLHSFGEWWVVVTAKEGYGNLLKSGGKTLTKFLLHLPSLHTRIVLIFPELQPPEFECSDVEDGSLLLHYRSHRKGLSPFVVGLLRGLGRLFETPVDITHLHVADEGADHDVFKVSWTAV
jgi:hypothetical protein